jgi:hypothetical protein
VAKAKTQESLDHWTKQDWGTKSGKPSTQGPKATGEVYLPKSKREQLSSAVIAGATKKKREATDKGEQYAQHGLAAGTSKD